MAGTGGLTIPKAQLHHIQIRSRDSGKTLTPMNCEVLIDGRPLVGCRRISFDMSIRRPDAVPIVLELLASVDIEGDMAVESRPASRPEEPGA